MFPYINFTKSIFYQNTHGLAYVAFSNISSRLWLGDNAIWRILSIKEIYQVFIEAYKPLLLQRLLKIFNHGQYGLTHIVLSEKKKKEKKKKIAFDLRFTYQKFYPETILSSLLHKFPQKALFIFFSIYSILEKFESGTIRVDPYCR